MSETFYSTETRELARSPARRRRNLRFALLWFIAATASAVSALLELADTSQSGSWPLLQIFAAIVMAALAGRELLLARAAVDDPEQAMGPVLAVDRVGVHYRDLGMGSWRTLPWEEMVAIEWAGDNIGVRRSDGEVEMVNVAELSEDDRGTVEQMVRDRLGG